MAELRVGEGRREKGRELALQTGEGISVRARDAAGTRSHGPKSERRASVGIATGRSDRLTTRPGTALSFLLRAETI